MADSSSCPQSDGGNVSTFETLLTQQDVWPETWLMSISELHHISVFYEFIMNILCGPLINLNPVQGWAVQGVGATIFCNL
jgi:hypothetical protein